MQYIPFILYMDGMHDDASIEAAEKDCFRRKNQWITRIPALISKQDTNQWN